MADVASDTLNGSTIRRESISNTQINLSTICLGGNRVARGEAGFLAEHLVQLVDLLAVIVEDGHERGLGTSCTLSTTELALD